MSQITNNNSQPNWKRQIYLIGTITGTLFGFVAAYLYARAAEENVNRSGKPRLQTGEAITLGLALLSLVRQISEMGKPPDKKN